MGNWFGRQRKERNGGLVTFTEQMTTNLCESTFYCNLQLSMLSFAYWMEAISISRKVLMFEMATKPRNVIVPLNVPRGI